MYSLFSKETADVYILFGVNSPDNTYLPDFKIEHIALTEEIGSLSPSMNVKFYDRSGFIIYKQPIMPNYVFTMRIGKSSSDYFEYEFKLSNISYSSTDISDMMNVLISIDLVSAHWEKIYKIQKSRSYSNRLISEVVAQISNEIGYTSKEIEQTNAKTSYIQPYWTNARFIKWLADNALTSDRKSGYVFFCDRNDKFSFKTYTSMYKGESVADLFHSSSREGDENDRFALPTITNNYIPHMRYSGFGMTHVAYDYDNREFIREVVSPDRNASSPLSSHHMIATDHISSEIINYCGRDIKPNLSENILVKAMNNVQSIDIVLNGRTDIAIGEVVTLKLPVSIDSDTFESTNHIYGGKWLVSRLGHQINIPKKDYSILCKLTRNGINLPDIIDESDILKAR